MNDADKVAAVKESVISHTIMKANGTVQAPKRVQNWKR
jgi:hypothetical protein